MDTDHQPEKYDLNELKRQITAEIHPLIAHLKSPLDRFRAYESLLRDDWSNEIAYKAFHEARQIEDREDKFYSLQGLSNDLYFHSQDTQNRQPEMP